MNLKLNMSLIQVCCLEMQTLQTEGNACTKQKEIILILAAYDGLRACMAEHVLLEGASKGKASAVVLQDAQSSEVQAYFSQWGPVNSCQLVHNDSALIALISHQGPLQVATLHKQICFQLTNIVVFASDLQHISSLALDCLAADIDYVHHSSCALLFMSVAGDFAGIASPDCQSHISQGCAYLQVWYTVCGLTQRNKCTYNRNQAGLRAHKHCR